MIARLESYLIKLRRLFSRREWARRLLSYPRPEPAIDRNGLIMIQIDGLAKTQFESAMENHRLPFLKSLIEMEDYRLHTMYSGLPSSTPAFQGELFYGIKCIVPAFKFKDHTSGRILSMLNLDAAATIESRLKQHYPGVCADGCVYADIYTGGAAEAHFCPASKGWGKIIKNTHPLSFVLVMLMHGWMAARILALTVIEGMLAVHDFFTGIIHGRDFIKELLFVPTRIGICILMRELTTIGAKIDIARGIKMIHLNYLGFDEQAHRRGPTSAFAHWTLKGIDRAIEQLWHAAATSTYCHYDLWIYSDHGQEETLSFQRLHGFPVDKVINDILADYLKTSPVSSGYPMQEGMQLQRITWLKSGPQDPSQDENNGSSIPAALAEVAAQGPIGHVYPRGEIPVHDYPLIARAMAHQGKIPLVLIRGAEQTAQAWTENGEYMLPDEREELFGEAHPFINEIADDLVTLVHHPSAGSFVISGWRQNGPCLSFPRENGAHAGPGYEETRAFALLPDDVPLPPGEKTYLRPIDLHHAIRNHLREASNSNGQFGYVSIPSTREKKVRIMTYNVHSCIGMDGKLAPLRIARTIARYQPDIIALQELDVRRDRTSLLDQADILARTLNMSCHFHPALKYEEEEYGDAILTPLPCRLIKNGSLPTPPLRPDLETRGAIWVEIEVQGEKLQLINTHLGLTLNERRLQITALLGNEWSGNEQCRSCFVLCGDFNTLPYSPLYRRLVDRLHDVQGKNLIDTPRNTWFGRFPIGRIDYIFTSADIKVLSSRVPRTKLTCMASDHLPLIADIELG